MKLTTKSPLTDVLLEYTGKRELAKTTLATYPGSLRILTEVTGLRTVEDMERARPGKLQDKFDAAIAAGTYSKKTLAMAFVLGKSLRRHLRLKDLVESNCFDAVKVRVGNNVPEANVLQPGELEKLLEVLKVVHEDGAPFYTRRPFALQWRAVILMLGRHGLRIHELAKLTVDDVRQDGEGGKWVATFKGKGNRLARMALSNDAVLACQAWRRFVVRRTGGTLHWFCPSSTGGQLSRITVAHVLGDLTQEVLGHRVTPHGFRATFISGVIAKHGIEAARKLARHSSLSTTQRYSRWEILDTES